MNSLPIAKSPLELPPDGMRLKGALLSTYDPPSADVLLDEFLPRWLGMERRAVADGTDAAYFAERARLLRETKRSIAIFHSQGTLSGHPWLWSQVNAFPIATQCRQHAKVWLFHWVSKTSKKERLQVVVSSMNLTVAALKTQVQALWHATVSIEAKATSKGRKAWGGLSDILEALPKETSKKFRKEADKACRDFSVLLDRSIPPQGVTFVASIPRTGAALPHQQVAAAIKGMKVTYINVLTPFVGPWKRDALAEWCDCLFAAKNEQKRLGIFRQEDQHSKWCLEEHARPQGVDTRVLGVSEPLFEGYSPFNDHRWVHAKIYELAGKVGKKKCRHVLITSANFTQAAWGNPKTSTAPKNFELGVLFEGRGFAFDPAKLDGTGIFPEPDEQTSPEPGVLATWDGKRISVDTTLSLVYLAVLADRQAKNRAKWVPEKKSGEVPTMAWPSNTRKGRPTILVWKSEDKPGSSAIQWVGKALDDGSDPPTDPSIPDDRRDELEAGIIAERYGGKWVDGSEVPQDTPPDEAAKKKPETGGDGATYSIEVIETARDLGVVIDGWCAALAKARARSLEREVERVLDDGKRLWELWTNIESKNHDLSKKVAYQVSADELLNRLGNQKDGER